MVKRNQKSNNIILILVIIVFGYLPLSSSDSSDLIQSTVIHHDLLGDIEVDIVYGGDYSRKLTIIADDESAINPGELTQVISDYEIVNQRTDNYVPVFPLQARLELSKGTTGYPDIVLPNLWCTSFPCEASVWTTFTAPSTTGTYSAILVIRDSSSLSRIIYTEETNFMVVLDEGCQDPTTTDYVFYKDTTDGHGEIRKATYTWYEGTTCTMNTETLYKTICDLGYHVEGFIGAKDHSGQYACEPDDTQYNCVDECYESGSQTNCYQGQLYTCVDTDNDGCKERDFYETCDSDACNGPICLVEDNPGGSYVEGDLEFDGKNNTFDLILVSSTGVIPAAGQDYEIVVDVENKDSEAGHKYVQCSVFDKSENSWLEGVSPFSVVPVNKNCVANEPNTQTASVHIDAGATERVGFTVKMIANNGDDRGIYCAAFEQCASAGEEYESDSFFSLIDEVPSTGDKGTNETSLSCIAEGKKNYLGGDDCCEGLIGEASLFGTVCEKPVSGSTGDNTKEEDLSGNYKPSLYPWELNQLPDDYVFLESQVGWTDLKSIEEIMKDPDSPICSVSEPGFFSSVFQKVFPSLKPIPCAPDAECVAAKDSNLKVYEENKMVYDVLYGNAKSSWWLSLGIDEESIIEDFGVCMPNERDSSLQFKLFFSNLFGLDLDDPNLTYYMVGVGIAGLVVILMLIRPPAPRRM